MRFRFAASNLLAVCRTPAAETAESRESMHRLDETVIGLFDRLREPLLRYLWSFGLGFADCEEIIQDAFLLLYRHLRSGKPDVNLRGWLFRVVHCLALKRRSQTWREMAVRGEFSAVESSVDSSPSPEDQVLVSQYRERMLAIIDALSEQDRRCLCLRAEGLRYREIA
jgi:RNA polymerase sigma-70 factor (ECF subfamily)